MRNMDRKKAIEVLVDNICTRLSLFAIQIDIEITDPQLKIISVHEWLLFLIHHIDRLAFHKGLPLSARRTIREEILRGLLNREVLPPRIEERLIEDGVKSTLDAFGTSRPIAIESLLPLFAKEANERDEYYSTCTDLVGKYPWDERGLINKLSNKILERSSCAEDTPLSGHISGAALVAILDEDLAKIDMKALDTVKVQ